MPKRYVTWDATKQKYGTSVTPPGTLVRRVGKYACGPTTNASDPNILVVGAAGGFQTVFDNRYGNFTLTLTLSGVASANVTVTDVASGNVIYSGAVNGSWTSGPTPYGTVLKVNADPQNGYSTPSEQVLTLVQNTSLTLLYAVVSTPTSRPTDRNQIAWQTQRFLPTGADLEAGVYGPIQGDGSILLNPMNVSWQTPGQPTVVIPGGYSRLLRFRNWNIEGGGSLGGTGRSGMLHGAGGNRLDVAETMFFARPPIAGYAGAFRSRAITMDSMKKLSLTNSMLFFTAGIYLAGYTGSLADDGIYLARNWTENVDGRYWMADGTINPGEDTAGKTRVQFIQINNMYQVPYLGEDNYVVKDVYANSECEDVYSKAASTPKGTGIDRRFLTRGISCYDPLLTPSSLFHGLRPDTTERNYNGGPGLAGDLGVVGGMTKSADTVPHNWEFQDGVSLGGSSSYCGPSISAGNNNALRRITVFSPGVVRSSTNGQGFIQYGRTGYTYVIDYGTGNEAGIWGNHTVEDLTLGIFAVRKSLDGTNYNANGNYTTAAWYPKNGINFGGQPQGTTVVQRITSLAKPASVMAALDQEDAYAQQWFDMQAAAGRVIGCHL